MTTTPPPAEALLAWWFGPLEGPEDHDPSKFALWFAFNPETDAEIRTDYERHTGTVIAERMAELDPAQFPGCLVANHGPFAWGPDAAAAVHNAAILEHLARLASETLHVHPYPITISQALLDKHFRRKHGPGAYYGQE